MLDKKCDGYINLIRQILSLALNPALADLHECQDQKNQSDTFPKGAIKVTNCITSREEKLYNKLL